MDSAHSSPPPHRQTHRKGVINYLEMWDLINSQKENSFSLWDFLGTSDS